MKKKKEEVEIMDVVVFDTETDLGEPEPNVVFAGKEWRTDEGGKLKLLPMREAPTFINTATGRLSLPPSDVQTAAPFWSEHADFLLRNFPAPSKAVAGVFYKKPTKKELSHAE